MLERGTGSLKKQYSHYDEYYVVSGCIKERRDKFNKLWEIYKPYCDSHFLLQVKIDFNARTWEMYLGNILLEAGFRITSSDHGPDLKIVSSVPPVWVEAVTATKGQGPDAVPPTVLGRVYDVPYDQMLLRLAHALDKKATTYKRYLATGIITAEDPFMIAVNGGLLGHGDPEVPLIFKCLFSLGYLTIPIPIGGEQAGESYMSRREDVYKKTGKPVSLGFFEKEENRGISAVLYSMCTVLNHPVRLGADCIVVHNPKAANPIEAKLLGFMEQWELAKGQIRRL